MFVESYNMKDKDPNRGNNRMKLQKIAQFTSKEKQEKTFYPLNEKRCKINNLNKKERLTIKGQNVWEKILKRKDRRQLVKLHKMVQKDGWKNRKIRR